MIEVGEAVKVLEKGPRGGDLTDPRYKSEWRQKSYNGNDTGLHRANGWEDTAAPGLKNEQPWQHMAAFMLNAGRTNSEIAMAAGVTPGTVSHLRAQRWFQELCARVANTEGEEILGVIRSEIVDSVNTIVAIRDDTSLPARVRLSAAITMLEQGHGKPIQKNVSLISHSTSSPEEEMARIQEELRALRRSQEIPEKALPSS